MDLNKIKPLRDHVLIETDEAADQIGSIIVPDVAKVPKAVALTGKVIAVGEYGLTRGKKPRRFPMPVKPGDHVAISEWWRSSAGMGSSIRIDDKRYVIVKADEIAGILG